MARTSGSLWGLSITRAVYAPLVLVAPTIAAWLLVEAWVHFFMSPGGSPFPAQPPLGTSLIALAGFVIPGTLAWRRVLRTRELIPASRLRERPVVAFVVAFGSSVSLALLWLVISVYADAADNGFRADLGPLGGALILATMSAAIALLVGEFVLIGCDAPPTDPRPGPPSQPDAGQTTGA